ncbi:hypothetical protein D3C72_1549830 [compost metagenome]
MRPLVAGGTSVRKTGFPCKAARPSRYFQPRSALAVQMGDFFRDERLQQRLCAPASAVGGHVRRRRSARLHAGRLQQAGPRPRGRRRPGLHHRQRARRAATAVRPHRRRPHRPDPAGDDHPVLAPGHAVRFDVLHEEPDGQGREHALLGRGVDHRRWSGRPVPALHRRFAGLDLLRHGGGLRGSQPGRLHDQEGPDRHGQLPDHGRDRPGHRLDRQHLHAVGHDVPDHLGPRRPDLLGSDRL